MPPEAHLRCYHTSLLPRCPMTTRVRPVKSHRRPLPLGRVFFSDLPAILGMSPASVRRRYRPAHDTVEHDKWVARLDIRERDDGILHCDEAKVNLLREELIAGDRDGILALHRSSREDHVSRSARFLGRRDGAGAAAPSK